MLTLIMFCVIISFMITLYRFAKNSSENIIIEGLSGESLSESENKKLLEETAKRSSKSEINKKVTAINFDITTNGTQAIDDQYFYDKLFDNVTYYGNEYDTGYNLGDIISTGWDKCKNECNAECVEYGITGNTYCI